MRKKKRRVMIAVRRQHFSKLRVVVFAWGACQPQMVSYKTCNLPFFRDNHQLLLTLPSIHHFNKAKPNLLVTKPWGFPRWIASRWIFSFYDLAASGFKEWITKYDSGYIVAAKTLYMFYRCEASNTQSRRKRRQSGASGRQRPLPRPRPC